MDVQREFEAAMRRVRAATNGRALDAERRIRSLTPLEQHEVEVGVRQDPRLAEWERLGMSMRQAAATIAQAFAAFNRGFRGDP